MAARQAMPRPITPPPTTTAAAACCWGVVGISSLRRHYPVQVPTVGGPVAALSARWPGLPCAVASLLSAAVRHSEGSDGCALDGPRPEEAGARVVRPASCY